MIFCDHGITKIQGDRTELMADISYIIQQCIHHDKLDPVDILEVLEIGLEGTNVKIVNGGTMTPDEFKEMLENTIDCEDCENCDLKEECDKYQHLNQPKEEHTDFTADDIFKNFFNE